MFSSTTFLSSKNAHNAGSSGQSRVFIGAVLLNLIVSSVRSYTFPPQGSEASLGRPLGTGTRYVIGAIERNATFRDEFKIIIKSKE